MSQINSYLTSNGNCRVATTFYKECLGGELMVQTVGELTLAEEMPSQMKECIFHSPLTKSSLVLKVTDMVANRVSSKEMLFHFCLIEAPKRKLKPAAENFQMGVGSGNFWEILSGAHCLATLLTSLGIIGCLTTIKINRIVEKHKQFYNLHPVKFPFSSCDYLNDERDFF